MTERFHRNELLFGSSGQMSLKRTKVAIVGVGGIGSHVAQQLAYLGVRHFVMVDPDVVEESNLNRLIGASERDVGVPKVTTAQRVVCEIEPAAAVSTHNVPLQDASAHKAIRTADIVFGCVDRDLARLELTALASDAGLPYFDLASDSGGEGESWYGGRVVFAYGQGCLSCLKLLDQNEIRRDGLEPQQRAAHDTAYGIDAASLELAGPSVVSVNGVVASLAVTSFMELVTCIKDPPSHLIYRGELRSLTRSLDEPRPGCFYCEAWRVAAARSRR